MTDLPSFVPSTGRPIALFLVACGLALSAMGQEQDPASAVASASEPTAEKRSHWQFGAWVDTAYETNFNFPVNRNNVLRNFDVHDGVPKINAATVTVQYMGDHVGFHLEGGYGSLYDLIGNSEAFRGPNRYTGQFYLSYKPKAGSGLQFDFGKFYTSAGAEVPETAANFTYSRSLVFVLGLPYYHFGLRATLPLTKSLAVGAQIVNGNNNVVDNNAGKTIVLTSTVTRPKWGWAQTFIVGPEKDNINRRPRQMYDSVLTVNPKRNIQSYVEFVAGSEGRLPGAPASSGGRWTGVAGAVRIAATSKLSFSQRLEYIHDNTGLLSGAAQALYEWTESVEYRPRPFMIWRLEYRSDHSSQPFFERDGGRPLGHNQPTLVLGVVLAYKTER